MAQFSSPMILKAKLAKVGEIQQSANTDTLQFLGLNSIQTALFLNNLSIKKSENILNKKVYKKTFFRFWETFIIVFLNFESRLSKFRIWFCRKSQGRKASKSLLFFLKDLYYFKLSYKIKSKKVLEFFLTFCQ